MNYYNENDPKAAAWLRELIALNLIPFGHVDTRSITEISPHELTGYTQQHFFAGIGGWSLALALAGWPANRPVRTGSCPCQPFSDAGSGKGELDPRHLWPHFRDLITFGEATDTFGEQVASKAGRVWLARVRADLEGLGYAVGAADLCSAGIGSPNRRQRLYWLAHALNQRHAKRDQRKSIAGGRAGPRPETLRCGELVPVANSYDIGSAEHGRESGGGNQKKETHSTDGHGLLGGVAHSDGGNAGPERQQRGRKQRLKPEDGGAGAVGDSHGTRLEQQRGRIAISAEQLAPELRGDFGYWSAFDLLACTDGKTRRIEPGAFPLVAGLSGPMVRGRNIGLPFHALASAEGRSIRLRGYGNAINPWLAAEFIAAYLDL